MTYPNGVHIVAKVDKNNPTTILRIEGVYEDYDSALAKKHRLQDMCVCSNYDIFSEDVE